MNAFLIAYQDVSRVLLADGWHTIQPGSFITAPYDYGKRDTVRQESSDRIYATYSVTHGTGAQGFFFIDQDTGDCLRGPLSSILAIAASPPEKLTVDPRCPLCQRGFPA